MRIPLLASLIVISVGGAALAQVNHQFPGASSGQFTPPPPALPAPIPPGGTPTQTYPNTESFARDRAVSQGYKVQRMERQVDGAWKADAGRAGSLTQPPPRGVPSKVTIFPDGRMVEEY